MELDTDPKVAARYHELIAALSPMERLARASRLSADVRTLAIAGLGKRHRGAGRDELRWRLAALCYGREMAERTFGALPRHCD